MIDETTLKFLCDDDFELEELVAALGGVAEVGVPEITEEHHTYLDTRSRSLAKAGLYGLCRRRGRRREVEVAPVPIVAKLVMPREASRVPVSTREAPGRVLRRLLEEEVGLKIRGLPVEQVILRTRRRRYVVTRGEMRASLRVDEVAARRPRQRRSMPFGEVVLEHLDGPRAPFDEVARILQTSPPLIPSRTMTFVHALDLLKLPGFSYGAARPTYGPQDPVDEVARAICLGQLRTVQSYEPGTRVGLDTEHLHKMRVATRRLRAALVTFSACFDQRNGDFLRRNFKWLAALLGDVRDLDVHRLDLRRWRRELGDVSGEGWERLGEVLEARWRAARQRLLDAMATRRYQRLLERAEEAFTQTPRRRRGHPGLEAVGTVASRALRKRVRQFQRAIRASEQTDDPEAVHQLRIIGKKLRYTIEFFRPLFSERYGRGVKRLATFQDELGLFQDSVVAGILVRELRDEALGSQESPSYVHVLGLLLGSSLMGATFGQVKAKLALDALQGRRLVTEARREARRLDKAVARGAAEGV